jgi:hypothetical protein
MDLSRVVRHLVASYPAAIRDRYGDEIRRLLEASDRPARDAANVLRHALSAHLEEIMQRDVTRVVALISAGLALVVFGFSLNDLERGLVEVPEHWWSTLVAGVSLGAVALVATMELRRLRAGGR